MKICAVICEYNPFHNGHSYLIEQAKQKSGCDMLVCIMSGNFTQRGEIAIFDKYTRAKHAIHAGADAVIELPTVFSVASAELFAKGAVKLLSSIPDFTYLACGCETPDIAAIQSAAQHTQTESTTFKEVLKRYLNAGLGFAKAKTKTLEQLGNKEDAQLLSSPNNILCVEYQKALNFFESKAQILPIERIGDSYTEIKLSKNFSSATAIRKAVAEKKYRTIKKNVPPYVYSDLKSAANPTLFEKFCLYAAIASSPEQLKKILDCNEGLENRIQALAKDTHDYNEFIQKVTTKRYTSARIRRILTAAAVGITEDAVRKALRSPLYLKLLAVEKSHVGEILSTLKQSVFPCITRRGDLNTLSKTAEEIYQIDKRASDIYNLATNHLTVEEQMRLSER